MSESIHLDATNYRCGETLVATPDAKLGVGPATASLWYIVEGADPRFDTRHLIDERDFTFGEGVALTIDWHPPGWRSRGVSLSWWVRIRAEGADGSPGAAHWRRIEVLPPRRDELPEPVFGELSEDALDVAERLRERERRAARRRIVARSFFFILAGLIALVAFEELSVALPVLVFAFLVGLGPQFIQRVRPGLRLEGDVPVLTQGGDQPVSVHRVGWFRADTIRWRLLCRETRSYRPQRPSRWAKTGALADEVFDIEVDSGALHFDHRRRARVSLAIPVGAPVTLWTETRRVQWLLQSRYRVAGVDQVTETALPVVGVDEGEERNAGEEHTESPGDLVALHPNEEGERSD